MLGGGIAGVDIATHLAGQNTARGRLAVTLIDPEPAHVWKPMLHTTAAGTQEVHQQQTAYVAQARAHGIVYYQGEVTSIDRFTQRVRLKIRCSDRSALDQVLNSHQSHPSNRLR